MNQHFTLRTIYLGLLILTFCSSPLVKAQEESHLFKMIENPNKLNILDRHYNADESIEYGIGNVLRITQLKNKDKKPEKSILKMWDIGSNEWVVYLEKKYIYKDNRLEEEQIWQYRQQVSLSKISPRRIEKTQHHFDAATRTDSIVTTGQTTSLLNENRYPVVTVNYLNQFDLPDSTLTYTMLDNKLSRKLISRMTYNEKELVEVATDPYYIFSTGDIPDNEHPFRAYTYFKSTPTKRTCLYIDARGRTSLGQYAELDEQGRICREEIIMEDSIPLLQAEYQYDNQQRTIVHKVIYGDLIVRINGLVEKSGFKYDLNYTNDGGEIMTHYTRDNDQKEFCKDAVSRRTYTPSQQLTLSQIEYYNDSEEQNYAIKEVKSYNKNDKLISQVQFKWDKINKWQPNSKKDYEYDDYGYLKLSQHNETIDGGQTWQGSSRMRYQNDTHGRVLSEYTYSWNKTLWETSSKRNFTYSPTGKVTSMKSFYRSLLDEHKWRERDYYTITYDKNDSIQSQVFYDYGAIKSTPPLKFTKHEWIPLKAEEFTYFPHGNEEIDYRWIGNIKTPHRRYHSYSTPDSTANSICHWDSEKKEWTMQYKRIEYFKGDSIKGQEVYDADNEFNVFAGSDKLVKEKIWNENRCYTQETKYTWDFKKKDWIPFTRMIFNTDWTNKQKQETYDSATGKWNPAK